MRKLYSIILLSCFSIVLQGQTLNFNIFGIEEGLPQSGINSLVQDNEGNIWVGTMSGVSKYNGLKFENYNKKNGLTENRIVSSCIDKQKNIWFGHWAGGLSVYVARTKKFKHVVVNGIDVFKSVNCIFEDRSGTLWFGTNGQGLLRLAAKDNQINTDTSKSITLNFSILRKADGLTSDGINSIDQDKHGSLWLATDDGAIRFIPESWKSKNSFEHLGAGILPSNSITSVLCDSKDRIWLGSVDMGIFRLNSPYEKQVKIYDADKGLSSNDVNVIFEDVEQNIFIGTFGGGVSKYLPALETDNYKGPVFQTISTRQGLSNDKVLSIIQDREKNIWIGTYLNLNQYFEEQFEIYGSNEGLENSLIWSVMQDKEGRFWLGTEGGLIRFTQGLNANQNEFVYYTAYAASGGKGKTTATTALFEDAEGQIWFTNYGNGVSRLDPASRRIVNYTIKDGLASNDVFAITGDNDNNIWMGTNRGGVSKFDLKTKTFKNYTVEDSLGSNYIYCVFKDSKNNMWFGGLGGDLSFYDGKTFRKFGEKDGYKNKFTVCITEDKSGNIWLGTYDGGIYKYDGKTFKNYSIKEGLSSETPFLMQCDNRDNLWIGTTLGLDKFNLNDESFKHYGKEDGFLGIEINPNAVCKDKSGNLWFGTIIGLVKYNSKRERSNLIEPITYLKNPRIFFNEEPIPANHIFSYSKNHFTFDFVGASLTNPKRVRYKYMLEGIDKEWNPPTKDNYVTYPNIPPGSYTFKVVSANNDGVWNKKPEIFTFTILPPWWKTVWFFIFFVIAVVSLIFMYFKWREKKLRERNKKLEETVELRTLELRKEKEHVEIQNVEISKQRQQLQVTNERILDSIDSAKAIQSVILPPMETIRELFSDSFVFYQPKDIVSGDFYWIHKKGDLKYFAVIDCVGHGVPGAFMTMLAYTFLESAVKDYNLTQPAEILTKLHEEILITLEKYQVEDVKTGMEIALVAINDAKGELVYSGTHNTLYIIRNGELSEIHGIRRTIGVTSIKNNDSPFENITHDIRKDDMLYVFTDGFPDQKGGPKKMKYYYPPFKALLLSIAGTSVELQKKNLEGTINDWMKTGERDQVDDILIMGVRIK